MPIKLADEIGEIFKLTRLFKQYTHKFICPKENASRYCIVFDSVVRLKSIDEFNCKTLNLNIVYD